MRSNTVYNEGLGRFGNARGTRLVAGAIFVRRAWEGLWGVGLSFRIAIDWVTGRSSVPLGGFRRGPNLEEARGAAEALNTGWYGWLDVQSDYCKDRRRVGTVRAVLHVKGNIEKMAVA